RAPPGYYGLGGGWLVSPLPPARRQEQRLAQQATEKAAEVGRPLADKAREAAMEVKDNLQEPAQQAVTSVKDTATEAGRTVVDEGKSAAQDAHANTREAASSGDVHQSPPSATYPSPERRRRTASRGWPRSPSAVGRRYPTIRTSA